MGPGGMGSREKRGRGTGGFVGQRVTKGTRCVGKDIWGTWAVRGIIGIGYVG